MAQTKEEIKKKDREYKRMKRRTDPEWLARERARRRMYGKKRFRNPKKYRQYAITYRNKEENKNKEKARSLLSRAVKRGIIKIPNFCENCNQKPRLFKDGRRALRADHYKGYKNPLIVKFICVNCDGLQLRAKNKLVKD